MNEDGNANFQATRLGCQLGNNSVVGSWCTVGGQQMCVNSSECEVSACIFWAAKPTWLRPRQLRCPSLLTVGIHSVVSKYHTRTCSTMKTKDVCKRTLSLYLTDEEANFIPQHYGPVTREFLKCHHSHPQTGCDITACAAVRAEAWECSVQIKSSQASGSLSSSEMAFSLILKLWQVT